MKTYNSRAEVPIKYQFDLSDFFPNAEEWEKEYQNVKENLIVLEEYQGKMKDSSELENFLEISTSLSSRITDLYVYAYLSHDVDLKVDCYTAMKNKASNLFTKYSEYTSFFEPEIIALSKSEFDLLFSQNPKLEKFRKLLEEIYTLKGHVLSKEEEKLISLLTDTFASYSNISSSLLNSEHNYGNVKLDDNQKVKILPNNIRHLKQNPNRTIRKNAHQKFGKTLKQYEKTASSLLHNYVQNNVNLAKIRNYPSAWDGKLQSIHIANEVFENLKKVAKKNATSWQKYYELIKKNLGLTKLYSYDINVPWNVSEKEYSIEKSEKIILEALKVLGSNYHEKLQKVFDKHYIDYCQYPGKTSGGYSFSTYNHDSRILLSFNENFDSILTVAHEAGHNVHHQYIKENNHLWYRDVSSFVAEVASLTNEFLVNHYFIENGKTTEERLLGIENTLKTFQNNFFSAVMEGELEQIIYKHVEDDNVLTADYLNSETAKLLKEYRGVSVEKDAYSNLLWVTRSHYYMKFYLYSYALCVSVASSVAGRIINKEEKIIERYENFLKCGSSMTPEEIYQKLEINLLSPTVFEEAVTFFNKHLELYEKISNEGGTNE